MRTKLSLLLALCRGAELLVLDEPTSGLDPAGTEEVLQAIVAHVAGENMTVFFSSHQLADVDQIADHIAIIDAGPDGRCRRARGPARRSTGVCSSCSLATRLRSRSARPASCARTDRVA